MSHRFTGAGFSRLRLGLSFGTGSARLTEHAGMLLLAVALIVPNSVALVGTLRSVEAQADAEAAAEIPDEIATLRQDLMGLHLHTLEESAKASVDGSSRLRAEATAILRKAAELHDNLAPLRSSADVDELQAAIRHGVEVVDPLVLRAPTRSTRSIYNVDETLMPWRIKEATLLGKLSRVALRREREFNLRVARLHTAQLWVTPGIIVLDALLWVGFLRLRRLSIMRDKAQKAAELAAIQRSEDRLAALVRHARDLILVVDGQGRVTFQSSNAAALWGFTREALLGRSVRTLFEDECGNALEGALQSAGRAPLKGGNLRLRLRLDDGNLRQTEVLLTDLSSNPSVGGVVLTVRDIEERENFERELTRRALSDTLTGLANRLSLHGWLEDALARSNRTGGTVTLAFVDLDNFKHVNDGLGHDAGDLLLVQVAKRLLGAIREENLVARLGGDEFVVLSDSAEYGGDASRLAHVVAACFTAPFEVQGRSLVITASVGVAQTDGRSATADSLLRDADTAMYSAKGHGRARSAIFSQDMHDRSLKRLELENDLRHAAERGELVLRYQPVIDMADGSIVGVEALIRWHHSTQGLISPADFIPLAEETGLITSIGAWVLEQACREMTEFCARFPHLGHMVLAVNVSPRQLQDGNFEQTLIDVLDRTKFPATSLKLEVTEGVFVRDTRQTSAILHRLKQVGVSIAVDDFGTGYSSLSYLRQLPIDELKIDRSFVGRIGSHEDEIAIVRTIITLAKSLGLSVTAEGVETAEQASALATLACERGQGYLFARPLELEDLPGRVAEISAHRSRTRLCQNEAADAV